MVSRGMSFAVTQLTPELMQMPLMQMALMQMPQLCTCKVFTATVYAADLLACGCRLTPTYPL